MKNITTLLFLLFTYCCAAQTAGIFYKIEDTLTPKQKRELECIQKNCKFVKSPARTTDDIFSYPVYLNIETNEIFVLQVDRKRKKVIFRQIDSL